MRSWYIAVEAQGNDTGLLFQYNTADEVVVEVLEATCNNLLKSRTSECLSYFCL